MCNLAGFRICLTKDTVHSLSSCNGLLTALVLFNTVAICCDTTQFLQKWCNYTCLCAWASERFFPWGGHEWIPPNVFLGCVSQSGEIWFLPLATKKRAFFAEIFKFVPPFQHPCLCVGKSSSHTIKQLV